MAIFNTKPFLLSACKVHEHMLLKDMFNRDSFVIVEVVVESGGSGCCISCSLGCVVVVVVAVVVVTEVFTIHAEQSRILLRTFSF